MRVPSPLAPYPSPREAFQILRGRGGDGLLPCGCSLWMGRPISSSMSANSPKGNTWLLEGHSEGEGRALFPGAGSCTQAGKLWGQDKVALAAAWPSHSLPVCYLSEVTEGRAGPGERLCR